MPKRLMPVLVAAFAVACAPASVSTAPTAAAITSSAAPYAPGAAPAALTPSPTPSAATPTAPASARPTFAVVVAPAAPGVDELFSVLVLGLAPGEQVVLNLHPVGTPGLPRAISANAAGVATYRGTTLGMPAGPFVAAAQRVDGATSEVSFNVQSSGAVLPPPNQTVLPAAAVRAFVPFECAAFTNCPSFDPVQTCSPAFVGATQALYHTNDVVQFEFCLPRVASSLSLWVRSTIPGSAVPPFSPFHEISVHNFSHEAGAFRASTPMSGQVETWTIRAVADGMNYDLTFRVAP